MGYVKNNYGCHCFYGDSAFKRYNRAAIGDTVIFNYNSNNTYNGCCGGRRGGGFWGGIGMGLGMGLGNLFGGLFGGAGFGGNMFSSMGMPFGAGFGNWGFGGASPAAARVNNNTQSAVTTKTLVDKDYDSINKLDAKADNLINKLANDAASVPDEDIDKLVAELQEKRKSENLDNINDLQNQAHIDAIIARLKKAKAGITPAAVQPAATTKTAQAAVEDPNAADASGFTKAQNAELANLAKDPVATKDVAKALGLTPDELIDLKKLGCFFVNIGKLNNAGQDVWALSMPKEITAENLEKLKSIAGGKNIPIACGVNLGSTDKFIAGNIGNIDNTNGLTFSIDASPLKAKNAARHGLTYNVTHKQDNNYEIKETGKTNKNATYKLEAVEIGGTYLNRTGAPLIKDEDIVQ